MKIIHNLGILNAAKDTNENAGFLLSNNKGGYCAFFSEPASRYFGMFYFNQKNMRMYKFIESIELAGNNKVELLKNNFYSADRKKGDMLESFYMPKGLDSAIYELSSENIIAIILDCKDSYDNREWGRNYEISKENGIIVVKFTKKTDNREDKTENIKEFELYLAIKSENDYFEKNDRWIERSYAADQGRKSPPFKRHVYDAIRLRGRRFAFTISDSRNSAMKECRYVFDNLELLKSKEKENFYYLLRKENMRKILSSKKIGDDVKIAYVHAANSLNNLLVKGKSHAGIFAGLPWFFQFWSRDTLISLDGAIRIDKQFSEKILIGYLNRIGRDGRLPNLIGHHGSKDLGSADSVGWLFVRCRELFSRIEKNKAIINSIKASINSIKGNKEAKAASIRDYVNRCNALVAKKEKEHEKLIYEIESSLEKSIILLLKNHTKGHFDVNSEMETWMDTEFGDDGRPGARIEMQALRLSMYKLMYDISLSHKYKILENALKIAVRHKFWDGKNLRDGLNDSAIRPNVFIASYAYPELLHPKEWEASFENSLKALWLDWGGLSTIDKSNPLFTEYYTGEDNKSYHRGDSWFWLNNLAAIQLNKINNKKFKKYIDKIISASTEDILWRGCTGCASEISSAKELSPTGCFSQAWSNAMYMEMVEEIYK